jgi:hypothetical protein
MTPQASSTGSARRSVVASRRSSSSANRTRVRPQQRGPRPCPSQCRSPRCSVDRLVVRPGHLEHGRSGRRRDRDGHRAGPPADLAVGHERPVGHQVGEQTGRRRSHSAPVTAYQAVGSTSSGGYAATRARKPRGPAPSRVGLAGNGTGATPQGGRDAERRRGAGPGSSSPSTLPAGSPAAPGHRPPASSAPGPPAGRDVRRRHRVGQGVAERLAPGGRAGHPGQLGRAGVARSVCVPRRPRAGRLRSGRPRPGTRRRRSGFRRGAARRRGRQRVGGGQGRSLRAAPRPRRTRRRPTRRRPGWRR